MSTTIIRCALVAIVLVNSAAADDTPEAPKGNFMSSLKQSFQQNYDREVIRGYFDIGDAPDTHRYYCLVDPKTGKLEANGVAGTPTRRRDGMTAIQNAAVSFYSCSDAESKGLLVTEGYMVKTDVPLKPIKAVKSAPPVPPAAVQTPAPAMAAAAPATIPDTSPEHSSRLNTADPIATLQSFVEVYNAGNGGDLPALLGDSADFAWVQADGHTVWGHQAAADALHYFHAAGSALQLQSQEGHTISPASKTAIVLTRLRLTQAGKEARIIRCSGVMVQTSKGWRIASLFMTPEGG